MNEITNQLKLTPELLGLSDVIITDVSEQSNGSIYVTQKAFKNSVKLLAEHDKLDIDVLHGDGSSTVAKKGGDVIGYNGHKHFKGEKVIAIVDRNANVLSPFTIAAGNKNESPLFAEAFSSLKEIIKFIGATIRGSIMSLDGSYASRKNRKLIFNAGMIPNIPENKRNQKNKKRGRK